MQRDADRSRTQQCRGCQADRHRERLEFRWLRGPTGVLDREKGEETHDTSSRRRLVQRREGARRRAVARCFCVRVTMASTSASRRRCFCRNCIASTRPPPQTWFVCLEAQSLTRLSEPQFGQSQQARMLGERREVGFRAFSYPTDGRPSRAPRPLRLDLFLLPGCSGRADEIGC